MSVLGQLSPEAFLNDYWHKKPLLVRNAYPNFECPIDANDLAGLAGEEDVEARIVIEHGDSPWQLKHGPFFEDDFANLPASHWTLLVQAVDHWLPEVKELLKDFRFAPLWRLDDVMISYAPTGGSVGPHYDYYDVFLIQAAGKRRWQLDKHCDENDEYIKDIPLRILKHWHAKEDFILEPGDMLYVPPGFGHYGVSQDDDCMTISIGFRAPAKADMALEFAQFLTEKLPAHERYADADLTLQDNAGEITEQAIDRVKAILLAQINNTDFLASWFGQSVTEPKYLDKMPDGYEIEADEIEHYLQRDDIWLERNLASRFAFYQHKLFVDQQELPFTDSLSILVKHLCSGDDINSELLWQNWANADGKQLITQLVQMGALVFVDDQE